MLRTIIETEIHSNTSFVYLDLLVEDLLLLLVEDMLLLGVLQEALILLGSVHFLELLTLLFGNTKIEMLMNRLLTKEAILIL